MDKDGSGTAMEQAAHIPPRDEVVNCLVSGMRFLRGETSQAAQALAIRVLANIIIEHLGVSGYAIVRDPSWSGAD